MPRNLKEEFIFATIIEIIMCAGMTIYNTILAFTLFNDANISFKYQDFLATMGTFLVSLILVSGLGWCVTKITFFLASKIMRHKPSAVFKNKHSQKILMGTQSEIFRNRRRAILFIAITLALTIIIMCTMMSCLATVMYNDRVHADWSKFGNQFLTAWWHNACLVVPLQLVVCQPVAKLVLKKYQNRKANTHTK